MTHPYYPRHGGGPAYGAEPVPYDYRSHDRTYGQYPPRPQVVSTQPRPPKHRERSKDWSSGLFDCTDDCGTCACVWFCSPFYECAIIDREFGESILNICCCGTALTMSALRYRFRDRHNIRGDLFTDMAYTMFCYPCSATQLIRENRAALRHGEDILGDMYRN